MAMYIYTSFKNPGFIPIPDFSSKETVRHKQTSSVSSTVTIVSRQPSPRSVPVAVERSYHNLEPSRLEVIESNQSSRSIPIEEFEGCDEIEPDHVDPGSARLGTKVKIERIIRDPAVIPSEQSTVTNSPADLYELRFCTVCNTDQPVRAKHCSECSRCVATYDHHCPWLGNCIGEKNRLWFYLYLMLQLLEIASYMLLMNNFEEPSRGRSWLNTNSWRLMLYAIGGLLVSLIGSLFTVQTYLLCRNITTWEFFSRRKITYLQSWSRTSPFDKGVFRNFATCFALAWEREVHVWSFPDANSVA